MKSFQKLSNKRNLIMAFSAILAIVFLIVGLVFAGTTNTRSIAAETAQISADQNGQGVVAIRSKHNYHSVSASLRSGAKIYVGATTADQLKRNLIVEGTFQVGGSNNTVNLDPSEYTVLCNGVTGNNALFDAVPTGAVTVTVTANGHTASFEISESSISSVVVEADIPTYTAISVDNVLDGISSDYTADTLVYASGFSLTGTLEGGTTEKITNYESVEIVMAPMTNSTISHTFRVIYTNPNGSTVSANGSITNVKQPTYLTTVLQVNPNYTRKGDYWYDGDRSAFVYNMSRADFLKGLELTVYYANGERVLDLTKLTGPSFNYATGESVSIPNDFNFNSAVSEITFPLTVSIGNQNYPLSVTVSLEARQVVSLSIDENYMDGDGVYIYAGSTNLTSGTASRVILNDLVGKIVATYNSGDSSILNESSNSGLSISESALTPTADDIGKENYLKTLTLVYTASDTSSQEYSVTMQFQVRVKYEAPRTVFDWFSGELVQQNYRHPIDYSGITVQVRYGNANPVNVPLSDFATGGSTNYVQTKFCSDEQGEVEIDTDGVFTKDVKSVYIELNYEGTTVSGCYVVGEHFDVNKLPLTLPDIGAFAVTYNQSLSTDGKEITFSDDFDQTTLANILRENRISVTDENGNHTDDASINGTTVKFAVAGTYKLHFTLSNSDVNEVEWNDRNINTQYVEIKGNELIYTIEVAPSEVKVRVDISKTETTYGDKITFTVWFAAMGTNDWFELTNELAGKTGTTANITYSGTDVYGTSYNGSSYPQNVGQYSLSVKIQSLSYKASTYLTAPTFKITPAELNADTVISYSYDRVDRHFADFINPSTFGIQYSESVSNIMTATNSSGAVDLDTKTYKNVSDSETLTLTLTSKNYYWKNSSDDKTVVTKTVDIEITALNLGITINSGDYDFIYGGINKADGSTLSNLPALSISTTAKDAQGSVLDASRFYAKQIVEYYLASEFSGGAPIAGATALDVDKFDEWNYEGTNGYVAYVKTEINTDNGDKAGDYYNFSSNNLPTHYVTFTVLRAQIDKVSFADDGNSTIYTANDITLNLTGWQDVIMTAAITSTVTTNDTSVDQANGEIIVKHAGRYTVTVTLDDNHDWNVADANDATNYHYNVTFTYTVDKKELEIQLDYSSFDYDGTAHRPTVSFVSGSTSATELNLDGTTVYRDSALTTALTSDPYEIGEYYIAVTSWSSQSASGYDVANNYKIFSLSFSIITSAMAKPTLIANGGVLSDGNTKVSVTYNGSAFDFEKFINNFVSNYVYGTSNARKIDIEITPDTSSRRKMIDADTYNVVITPATNFKWDTKGNDNDRSQVLFTFVINPKTLTGITWTNTEFTYDGNPHVPTATPTGLCSDDAGVQDNVTITVSGEQTNYSATAYTAIASSLGGDQGHNYTLPADKKTTFTIGKRSINVPTISGDDSNLTFNGNTQSLAFDMSAGFTSADVTGWNWGTVVEASFTSTVTTNGTDFDFDNGEFKFKNAGTYKITFTIKSEHVNNYCWKDVNGNDYSIENIIVNRLKINAPTISGDDSNLTFGKDSYLAFNTDKVSGFNEGWSTVVSFSIVGQYNFDEVIKPHNIDAVTNLAEGTGFNFDTGTFSFVNAGIYTITFEIRDEHKNNYVWNGEHQSEVTVNRKTIVAPKLVNPEDSSKTGRTLERSDSGADRKPIIEWNSALYPYPGNGIISEPSYGVFDGGMYVSASEFKNVGEYYICLTIEGNGCLNYVWAENESDTESRSFVTQYGKTEYTETTVLIYLNYAITQKILDLSYTVNGYTFGDNGAVTDKTGISDVLVLGGADLSLLGAGNTYGNVGVKQTITFIDEDGNIVGKVIIERAADASNFSEAYTETDYQQLENFLPWNAGTYEIQIKIEFTDDQLNELNYKDEYKLVVAKKAIEVTWTLVGSDEDLGESVPEFTYDNAEHTLVATISNVPQREGGNEQAPVLVVVSADGGSLPKNASNSNYTLKVDSIENKTEEGSGNVVALASNYKIDGDITHQIKINKRAITVNITSGGTSEYGDNLDTDNVKWDYAAGSNEFADESHRSYVTYELQKNGSAVSKYNADSYDIVAKLTSEGAVNYTLTCLTSGSYTVTARAITVSLNTDNTSKTYGTAVDLYSPAVYKVEYKGTVYTDENWLASGDTRALVFTVTSVASAASAGVGNYDITLTTVTNPNYTVTVSGTWTNAFTVNEADITVGSVTGNEWEYDATEHALIGNAVTVSGVVLQGGMTATYQYIKDDGTEWVSATGVTLKDVLDSGIYKIRITADNHTSKTLDGVQVTISKATLTVSLNLAIFYGEDSPADMSFLMNASDLSDSRYTVTGFKGTDGLAEVNASGTISYTTNYQKGYLADDYTLNLDVSDLSSDNYDFITVVDNSKLIVKALSINVEVEDIQATYWSLVGSVSPVCGNITLSTTDKDTYGDGVQTVNITSISAKDILTYTTSAITVDGSDVITSMAVVGTYDIIVKSGEIEGKYSLNGLSGNTASAVTVKDVAVASAKFEITNADLMLNNDVSGYSKLYDEAYHTLTVGGNGKFAETYNPSANPLSVKYYVSANAVSNAEMDINWNGADIKTELPEFINVGAYYLYYNLSATNHNSHTAYVVIEIKFTSNNFTDFGFEDHNTVFGSAGAVNVNAWIYGVGHADGYDYKGDIVEPVATFDGVTAEGIGTAVPVVFTLYYNGNLVSVGGTSQFSSATDLFKAVLEAGLFNAGDYRIHYEMAETANFSKAEGDRYFRVGKKALTITANEIQVTYGEDVATDKYFEDNINSGYNFTVVGLVDNGRAVVDSINDVFVGGRIPKFISTYVKGYENGSVVVGGGYAITLSNASELTEKNYSVTITGNTLKVLPREITITVADKQSRYNYNEASGDKITGVDVEGGKQTLGYSNIVGSFYEPDGNVIEFVTSAIQENTTNDVGLYPIFVRFTDSKHVNNYKIKVVGSFTEKIANDAWTGKDKDTYGKLNYYQYALDDYANYNAEKPVIVNPDGTLDLSCGTYKIVAANLKLQTPVLCWWDEENGAFFRYDENRPDPLEAHYYDGKYKGYTREPVGENYGDLTVTALYDLNDGKGYSATYVKNVGTYHYIVQINDTNYVYPVSEDIVFEILQRPITVEVTIDGVKNANTAVWETYKNGEFELKFTFNDLQQSEIIMLNANVTPTPLDDYDQYFRNHITKIYGEFATSNDAGANTYTIKVKNAGVYDIRFALADTPEMKNYSFSYTYKFTVNRADFTVKANSSVVQYGTVINQSGTAQSMSGVSAPSIDGVDAGNWDTVADYFRFYGFSLVQNVLDKVAAEGKIADTNIDYFYIGSVTYGFSGTAYNAATSQARSVFNIQPDASTVHAFNYNVKTTVNEYEYGKLYVAQRRINVTINGYSASNTADTSFASTIYNGVEQQPAYALYADNFFTPETNWFGAATGDSTRFLNSTATKMTVTNAINSGEYPMHAFQNDNSTNVVVTNNTNYKVTYVNDNEAKFFIAKKDIRIQAVSIRGNTSFDITYGDNTDGYYKVVYYGLVAADGGNSAGSYLNDTRPVDKYTLTNGAFEGGIIYEELYTLNGTSASGGVYTPWTRHAGQKFLIDISDSDLSFDNYNIVAKDYAVMTVVARMVTATTSDRVYTEDTDLHGGAYGIEHKAQIVFTDVKDSRISYTDSAYAPYAPNNYLSYLYVGTENGGTAYNSSKAPTKAGAYTVKITFDPNVNNYGDYEFDVEIQSGMNISATSVTFPYNVTKKAISLDWDAAALDNLTFNDGDEKYVPIYSPYVQAITDIHYVQLIKADSSVENIELKVSSGKPGDGQYTITEEGFTVKVYSVGTYSVVIEFNSDAANNYMWDEYDTMKNLTLVFSIYTDGFKIIDLNMESWIYNDVDENGDLIEHKPTYNLTNGVTVPIVFRYATVTGDLPAGVPIGEQFGMAVYESIKNKSQPSTNIPVNAGVYILVANYTDAGLGYSSTSAYFIFKISQREVESPVFVNAGATYVYNGQEQTAAIKYNHRELTGTYTGNSSLDTDGITLYATDARTYRIVFSLNDTRNYKWADDVITTGNAYAMEWKIAAAEDNAVIWGEEISVTYGDTILPAARSTYGGVLTEYYFASRNPLHSVAPADLEWTLWTEETKPVNSGYYWVKAVDRGNLNYNECEAAQKITINKAWLTVTANGSAIYGDSEEGRHFGYEFSGFINGTENVTVGNIEYVLEFADKYIAGTYGIQLKCADAQIDGKDVVEGMSAENYNITPAVGEFTVSRRSIMVILGSARSVYGSLIDLSQIEIRIITADGLAEGDTVDDLGINLEVDPDRNVDITSKFNNVGAYTVNAVGYEDNANYNIAVFGSGTYTIAPLSIFITAESGGGTYDSDDIDGAKITGIYAIVGEDIIDVREVFGDRAPTFRFNYWGTSNDGKWNKSNEDNCTLEPDRAGIYHATAVASNSDNFTLLTSMGMPSVTFTVEKKVIDESVISVAQQAYSNSVLTPVVTDNVYNGIYTVGEVSAIEVGTYNVPITLIDRYNYKWTSVEDAVYNLTFEIVRGENVIGKPEIKGWTYLDYNAEVNTPTAEVKFGSSGDFVFAYSSSRDGEYSASIPTNAGKYWVMITVPQTDNYYAVTSEPVEFEITKAKLAAPTLVMVAEGDLQNMVYTGSRLIADVNGYDTKTMRIIYDGDTSVGNFVAVFALNAGTYSVRFALNDADNYAWAEDVSLDEDGNAALIWNVARKKIAKPTMPSNMYMVNGSVLTFIPDGFDEETMNIYDNHTSYGGVFNVTVTLKDTSNYEWMDSSVDEVVFAWTVVGWDTVFVIIASVLGAVAGIALALIAVQFIAHKRKKRIEFELEAAIDNEGASFSMGNEVNQSAESAEPESSESENAESESSESVENTEEKDGGNDNE